jgi:hypothetical protein
LPFNGNENKIKYSSGISNVNCYEDQAIQQTPGNSEWHNIAKRTEEGLLKFLPPETQILTLKHIFEKLRVCKLYKIWLGEQDKRTTKA